MNNCLRVPTFTDCYRKHAFKNQWSAGSHAGVGEAEVSAADDG